MKTVKMGSPYIEHSFKIINLNSGWILNKKIPTTTNQTVWEIIETFKTKPEAIKYLNETYGTAIITSTNNKSRGSVYVNMLENKRKRLMKRITPYLIREIKS